MKRWKKILAGALAIGLVAACYGLYLYKKKPADIRTLTANYELTATALLESYTKDEKAADLKYLDKVIAVKGKISDIKTDTSGQVSILLETGDPMATITCSFYDTEAAAVKKVKVGEDVVIKGKCTGKLIDVILNKCSIEK